PLEQGRDGCDVRAVKSDLGETVFRDPHGGARLLHLPAQSLHLDDREAGIVSNDDDGRVLEDGIERRDELFLARSIHLDPLSGPRLRPRPETVGLHQPPRRTGTTLGCPAPRSGEAAPALEVRTGVWALNPQRRSFPVYAGMIKPVARHLQSRTGRAEPIPRDLPDPFRRARPTENFTSIFGLACQAAENSRFRALGAEHRRWLDLHP